MSAWRRAIANASMEAARLHQRMHTPYDRPVDVFLMAQRLGLWLAAQPLDKAFGFYLRQTDVAGIVVNSRHPESLQRYTCAHEIGHHILGHESHVDDLSTVGRYSQIALRELEAQVFAASLLMPLPLVRRVLRQVWDYESTLRPAEVYLFSRELGVSYAAAAWQLTQHKLLRASDAKRLVKDGAAAAKTELRGMSWVNNARADVWVLDERMNGITVACRTGDELHLRLSEDLSTGRVWMIDEASIGGPSRATDTAAALVWDEGSDLLEHKEGSVAVSDQKALLQVVPDLDLVYDTHLGSDGSTPSGVSEFLPTADDLVLFDPSNDEVESSEGVWPRFPGPGRRVLVFVPRTSGTFSTILSLRPAWDPAGAALATFSFTVEVGVRDRLLGAGHAAPQKDVRVKRLAAA